MRGDELQERDAGAGEETVTDSSGAERRRALRRKLPFGRGAVLLVGARAHIVGVADVSVTGAYLSTRAPVGVGETHLLRILLPPDHVEASLHVEIVRVAQAEHESPDHPRGVAVRFVEPEGPALSQLKAFVARERPRARD